MRLKGTITMKDNFLEGCEAIYGYDEKTKELLFLIDLKENIEIKQNQHIAIGFSFGNLKLQDIDGKVYFKEN